MLFNGFWAFNALIGILLAGDLFLHRKRGALSMRESLWMSAFWIGLAALFNLGIYFYAGGEAALLFLSAYLIEKMLSIDNLFVILLIFQSLAIPTRHQHKVLFWGLFGAIVFRALFILLGLALIEAFSWLLYLFGAFLIVAGIRLWLDKDIEVKPENNRVIIFLEKFIPLAKGVETGQFFIKGAMTPLFVALVMVETSDLLFAFDSIPAVFAITRDPFIAYTSNIFAILGLRSLFFAASGLLGRFRYLHHALALILILMGIKMLVKP